MLFDFITNNVTFESKWGFVLVKSQVSQYPFELFFPFTMAARSLTVPDDLIVFFVASRGLMAIHKLDSLPAGVILERSRKTPPLPHPPL